VEERILQEKQAADMVWLLESSRGLVTKGDL
jgi:hypothetical protein